VKADATPGSGAGFSSRRASGIVAGRYVITITTSATARDLITTVTPTRADVFARIVAFTRSGATQSFEIETKLVTGGLVDSLFYFIALELP
jgi:hypothetical protein